MSLEKAPGVQAGDTVAQLDGRAVNAQVQIDGSRTVIRFLQGLDITSGETLRVKHG